MDRVNDTFTPTLLILVLTSVIGIAIGIGRNPEKFKEDCKALGMGLLFCAAIGLIILVLGLALWAAATHIGLAIVLGAAIIALSLTRR